MTLMKFAVGIVVALAAVGASPAAFVVNGGFEDPSLADTAGYQTVLAGQTTITGWTVGGTSVDIVANSFFTGNPSDSNQSIDLQGTPGPGSVSQTVTTTAGQAYLVTFDFGRNFSNNPDVNAATLTVVGTGPLATTVVTSDAASLVFTSASLYFVADGPTATLTFASEIAPSVHGILLDNVAVNPTELVGSTATPAPAGVLVLAAGAGLLGVGRRRR